MRLVRLEHRAVHAGVQPDLDHVHLASLLNQARALAVDVSRVVHVVKTVADVVQVVVERMSLADVVTGTEDDSANLLPEQLRVALGGRAS